ncbi:MAG: hypothetical protein HDR11_16545 [Lachnospiraceae bacterium]|nr:hypothetical protein [Lachnospiraceae bacterium]
MFAASTYDEVVKYEQCIENKEIVVFLFVKPTNQDAVDIIQEFEYIYYNSAKYCSIYAIGYSNDPQKQADRHYRKVSEIINADWYFSSKAFVEFKNNLERRIKWEYSGETEVLILQNNPGEKDPLNFSNYVAIDVNKGLREGYIDSFQRFMESLIRSARSKVTAKEAASDLRKSHISIKDAISEAIEDSKKIPNPAKKIIKDRLFYRCANIV